MFQYHTKTRFEIPNGSYRVASTKSAQKLPVSLVSGYSRLRRFAGGGDSHQGLA